ncbi:MAG: hypothetical protein F4Z01_06510 [Gammaproteobacteria bacterium]|nr:hypothetical protein [Gammaproteobacteria bacterium]MYF38755.1 hypothetical protein [Gammaproteobacteria bacterium]
MLNLRTFWNAALVEMRACCRLVRTWVFFAATLVCCTLVYLNGFVSIFSIGIVLLAFDMRERDIKSRTSDDIDSQTDSDVAIIFGRIAGVLLLVMILFLVVLLLITGGAEMFSILSEALIGIGFQPKWVVPLIAWSLIPNLIFCSALIACLVALFRNRFLIATIALGVLLLLYWIETQIPVKLQESLSLFPGNTLESTDLAPVFVTPAIIGNVFVTLLVSSALFLFAASNLTRTKPGRRLSVVSGVSAIVIASILSFVMIGVIFGTENLREEWVNEHRKHSPASFPDIQDVTGDVELLPGRKVMLDVTLTVHPPSELTSDSVVLSLNPGYKILKLHIDGEPTTNFSFKAGILELPSALLLESSHEIRVQAEGKPHDRFAYLDQARDLQTLPDVEVRALGLQNSIFHNDFIALMPSVAWYPISGTVTDRDVLESRPRDLFTTDLTVTVPKTWQVATVGKRTVLDQQHRNQFRFRSGAPVPELALVASQFDQRVATIEGVEFQVLFNKNHLQNLEALAPINHLLKDWVADKIRSARAASLAYPYEVFYVVEVPSNLRIYGGGWRMDTVLQPPGMMLIREPIVPSRTIEFATAEERAIQRNSKEEQDERIFLRLLGHFGNDMHGNNPFVGIDRNFVSHQVSATQRGATALQHLMEQLSNQLISQMESLSNLSFKSVQEFGEELPFIAVGRMPEPHWGTTLQATYTRRTIAGLPSTWKAMDKLALFDLDFVGNPIQSYRVLLAKGHALAKSMIAYYGEEQIGEFLDRLLTEYRGQSFTVADFLKVASEVGLDFNEWVLSALEDTNLPGFLVEPATVSTLDSQEAGRAKYQTTFVVYNAEPMPGLVHAYWTTQTDGRVYWAKDDLSRSDPVFIAGHQAKRFAFRSETPLTGVWIKPFLAYNRDAFEVQLPKYDEYTDVKSPAFPFVADIDWRPQEKTGIVVDDLDPNFSIVELDRKNGNFIPTRSPAKSSDTSTVYVEGLPVGPYFLGLNKWHREFDPSAFGSYHRTFAIIAGGDQKSAARFTVSLPHDGRWNLDYFVPRDAFGGRNAAIKAFFDYDWYDTRAANPNTPEEHYTLTIQAGETDWSEEFDVANANIGWNDVGEFKLSSTEVEVLVSAWAGHEEVMVFADAIRWSSVSDTDQNEESSP